MPFQHKNLAEGRWRDLSIFEQLGNVGSEIHRALQWQDKDEKLYQNAVYRALELLDLTIQDPRWLKIPGRLKELTRAREVIVDAFYGGKEYGSTFSDLDRYFLQFALVARTRK